MYLDLKNISCQVSLYGTFEIIKIKLTLVCNVLKSFNNTFENIWRIVVNVALDSGLPYTYMCTAIYSCTRKYMYIYIDTCIYKYIYTLHMY